MHRIGGASVENLRPKPREATLHPPGISVIKLMETRTVKLIDQAGHVVATAQVADEGADYGGTIDLRATPPALRALFDEFEEIVNGQMFAFLDDIQGKIRAVPLRAVFDTGRTVDIKDLQVFPGTGEVSLRVAECVPGAGKLV
jgi:hypothetical protein